MAVAEQRLEKLDVCSLAIVRSMPTARKGLRRQGAWRAECGDGARRHFRVILSPMLNVFFTVDTEIWCGGWDNLDRAFPEAFRSYVYGPTPHGDYGLPMTLRVLNDHGLRGVFFVEPLFAMRFGRAWLQEVVGLIAGAGQEIQLHLHTEWVDEAATPLLPNAHAKPKRQHIHLFSRTEQTELVRVGLELLRAAGARDMNAFRAGNFAFNEDTLHALRSNGIGFDSSYNGKRIRTDVAPGRLLTQPTVVAGVAEYPVTVFRELGRNGLRPLHLTACSFQETTWVLNSALDAGWDSVVIVSHNFELLNRRRDHRDAIVAGRYRRLCRYLERHNDRFCSRGFAGLSAPDVRTQPEPLSSPLWLTAGRVAEQLVRRVMA